MKITLIAVVCFILVIWLIRKIIISRNRPLRRYDMERHIEAITDPRGCENPGDRIEQVEHIMKHYGISLEEVDWVGNLYQLKEAGKRAVGLYRERKREFEKSRGIFAK